MKNSINYAFREGKAPEKIARELGYSVEQVKKVLFPNESMKGKIVSIVVKVRKLSPSKHELEEKLRKSYGKSR
jgi:signal recognition particle subunit SEC65